MHVTDKKEKKDKIKKDLWEDYEYSPASHDLGISRTNTGLTLRALCSALLTLGLLLFVDDAFSLDCGFITLLLKAIYVTAIFSLAMLGGKKLLIGGGLAAAGLLLTLIMHGNPIAFFEESTLYTFDSVMKLLVSRGFENYSSYITGASGMGLEAITLYRGFTTLLAVILGALNSVCVMRKTVLSPVIIVSIGILMLGFTFNLNSSNWGFAIVLLSLFGIVVMRVFDASFKTKRKDRLHTAALGGYAAGAVMLLAFISVVIPAAVMKDQWRDIEFISTPMNVAREIVDSVISGDAPNLKDLGVLKNMDDYNSRNVTVKKQTFTGDTIMTVRSSYNKNMSVYLRGWIAVDFDGENWTTVTNDILAAYKSDFATVAKNAGYDLNGNAYQSEYMTEAFYQLVNPSLLVVDEEKGYANNYAYGFISAYLDIDMELGTGTGNILYLPSVISTSSGMMSYQNTEKPYKYKSDSYFDGIYITSWTNLIKKYTVLSYVPVMSNASFESNFTYQLNYFYAMQTLMIAYRSGEYSQNELFVLKYQVYNDYGLNIDPNEDTYFDLFLDMSSGEQYEAYTRYVTLVNEYTEYVKNTYGVKSEIQTITDIANEIIEEVGENASTHAKVLSAVQYMLDNFSYSLFSPKLPSAYSGYESFLRETHNGYYVQYATTVTLVLRELGITARYVEGYIANDFEKDDESGNRVCTVTDENAHGWVEVYYEGYGWMTYEVSESFIKAFYGNQLTVNKDNSTESGGVISGGSPSYDYTEDPIDTPIDEYPYDDPSESGIGGRILAIVIIIAAIGILGYFTFKKLRERSDAITAERRRRITDALNGTLEGEELEAAASSINADIFRMFSIAGFDPNVGELPQEYAARMEHDCTCGSKLPFTEIMPYIQKQEFGGSVDKEEVAAVADYLNALWKDVYKSGSFFKQFWYRYIKCQI